MSYLVGLSDPRRDFWNDIHIACRLEQYRKPSYIARKISVGIEVVSHKPAPAILHRLQHQGPLNDMLSTSERGTKHYISPCSVTMTEMEARPNLEAATTLVEYIYASEQASWRTICPCFGPNPESLTYLISMDPNPRNTPPTIATNRRPSCPLQVNSKTSDRTY